MRWSIPGLLGVGLLLLDPWGAAAPEELRPTGGPPGGPTGTSKVRQLEVDLLAKEFDLPPAVIQALRAKYGWGAITVQLVMAQHLAARQPGRYGSTGEALEEIEQLRAQGVGWGKIAQDLDLPLARVVREVQRVRQELRAGRKGARSGPEPASLQQEPAPEPSNKARLRQELRPGSR